MKAAWFEAFGDAARVLTVGDQDVPRIAANEVLIRLVCSGVNPSDVKKRAGSFPDLLQDGLVIPHSDGAGIVEAVGDAVTDRQVGDRVWVYQAQFGRRLGTAAQFVAVEPRRAPLLPAVADYDVGACLGIPAMTAHRCVHSDGAVEGQTILVTGGAGRVGYYAIQWAAIAGANVIATASNDADVAACRGAGASAVVNHRADNWAADVLAANGGAKIDRVIDVEFGANLPQTLELIKTGGRIVTYSSTVEAEPKLPFLRMMFMDLTIQLVIVYSMPEEAKQKAIADIERCLHAGLLQHRIASRFALEDIADAHEMVEAGACRGCVVIDID